MAQNGLRVVACAINPDVARSINPDALPPLAFVGFWHEGRASPRS